MPSVDEVMAVHKEITEKARSLIERKGRDYNRAQQKAGDTLFNLRVPYLLGLVDHPGKSCLVNTANKLMRLSSLIDGEPANSNEPYEDSVIDSINYLIYSLIMKREVDEQKKTPTEIRELDEK